MRARVCVLERQGFFPIWKKMRLFELRERLKPDTFSCPSTHTCTILSVWKEWRVSVSYSAVPFTNGGVASASLQGASDGAFSE